MIEKEYKRVEKMRITKERKEEIGGF